MTELFHEIELFSIHFWSEEVILKSEYDEKINICDERKGKKKLKIVSGCQPEFGNEVFDESYHGNWSYIAF